jgi:hypothetical protein
MGGGSFLAHTVVVGLGHQLQIASYLGQQFQSLIWTSLEYCRLYLIGDATV